MVEGIVKFTILQVKFALHYVKPTLHANLCGKSCAAAADSHLK
jgi:hypothetical protein